MNASQQRALQRDSTTRLKQKRSGAETEDDDFSLLSECLRIIDSVYQMRFIEKISRPIERRVKEEYVEKVAGKMETLHAKLQKIRVEIADKSNIDITNTKNKSVMGSVTHKPMDWKKSIRTIENRYIQVFIEGSFKFYHKLNHINRFSYPLKIMNIEEWSRICLNKSSSGDSCC